MAALSLHLSLVQKHNVWSYFLWGPYTNDVIICNLDPPPPTPMWNITAWTGSRRQIIIRKLIIIFFLMFFGIIFEFDGVTGSCRDEPVHAVIRINYRLKKNRQQFRFFVHYHQTQCNGVNRFTSSFKFYK